MEIKRFQVMDIEIYINYDKIKP